MSSRSSRSSTEAAPGRSASAFVLLTIAASASLAIRTARADEARAKTDETPATAATRPASAASSRRAARPASAPPGGAELERLRALANDGTTPAIRQLVRAALDHGGAYRAEIARLVAGLGDKAVPALIEARKGPPELRRWADAELESMGKRIPSDAVQTADNQVLADVLHAFAEVRDFDALPVILAFVNSDRVVVRTAAREAIAPFGEDAATKLREAYAIVTDRVAPEEWRSARLAKELFAAYDRLRLHEVYALVDEGLAKQREGKLDEALAAFDKVLARQPMLDRRIEMVSAYVAHAEALEATDPARAIAVYRAAARLWPDGPRAAQIDAAIAYLEGKDLLAHGVTDTEPFERALSLDPSHDRARAELARIEATTEQREGTLRLYASVAAAVLVALLGLILFGPRRRRRRRAAA